jgi:4-carboxymuconolactone decarboxylase
MTSSDDPTFDAGMKVRRAVLGDAHVDRAMAQADAFTGDFQDFITRYAWGAIWSRPGLGRRERSLITLALLAALGHTEEIPMHVRGALTNGVTREEISEVFLHTAVYAGVPAANNAFAVAKQTLDELA